MLSAAADFCTYSPLNPSQPFRKKSKGRLVCHWSYTGGDLSWVCHHQPHLRDEPNYSSGRSGGLRTDAWCFCTGVAGGETPQEQRNDISEPGMLAHQPVMSALLPGVWLQDGQAKSSANLTTILPTLAEEEIQLNNCLWWTAL